MKLSISSIFLLLLLSSSASSQTEIVKQRKFSFSLTPVEAGVAIPLANKKNESLPEPINIFTNNKTTGLHVSLLKLGLIYKEKYGIDLFYNFYSRLNYKSSSIENYLSENHTGYDAPRNSRENFYDPRIKWKGFQVGLFYRLKFKKFFLEPKFQIGIEKYTQDNFEYYLKQTNSNQFIEYYIKSEDPKKSVPSYHCIINFSRRFNPNSKKIKIELGIKFEYILMNVNLKYSVEELPYNLPSTNYYYTVKQRMNLFVIALHGKLYY